MTHADATALRDAIASGAVSATDVVRHHLDRIHHACDTLNAAVELLEQEALAQARSPLPGPLSGVPFSAKEIFEVSGRTVTMGSVRTTPVVCGADAEAIARLKAAGAILLARGNTAELTLGPETDNLRFGRTSNPLDPSRTAGGSSGGDAALVASGGVAFGLGSDMGGSIRMPAHCCGLVGFKPASAAVSKVGKHPRGAGFSAPFDAIGPLARSVRDVRLIYSVLSNTAPAGSPQLDALRVLVPAALTMPLREPQIGAAWNAAIQALEGVGMQRETLDMGWAETALRDYALIVLHEMDAPLRDAWMTPEHGSIGVWSELGRQLLRKPTIAPFSWTMLAATALVRPFKGGRQARAARLEETRRVVMDAIGPDGVVVVPTTGALAFPHGQTMRRALWPSQARIYRTQALFNALDLPAISVPAPRFSRLGLAPGVTLACLEGSEGALFGAAQLWSRLWGESGAFFGALKRGPKPCAG